MNSNGEGGGGEDGAGGVGTHAAVFAEPVVTLEDLPPIGDVELFEDENTPERLKAIIRHMRKIAGRRELSALIEYVPTTGGGQRFVATFPEGDEQAMCRLFAEEGRRADFHDTKVIERLKAAADQVKRAEMACEHLEHTTITCVALAGDIVEAFEQIGKAIEDDEDYDRAMDIINDVRAQLANPNMGSFRSFINVCMAERGVIKAHAAQERARSKSHGDGGENSDG
jgi:hypothetical protein